MPSLSDLLEDKPQEKIQEQPSGQLGDLLQTDTGKVSDLYEQAKIEPTRSVGDITGGAAVYGAAGTAEMLAKGLDRSFVSSSSLQDFSKSMSRFKESHPEYAPVEVNSALELLSNPQALTSQIFGNAAYLATQAGLASVPGVGWTIAGTTAYTVEAQRAYEQAIRDGATESEATNTARHIGAVNAGIQIMSDLKMLHMAKGDEGWLAQAASRSTNSLVRALGPAAGMSSDAAALGLLGAAQGAVNDGLAASGYGKDVSEGFLDRRLQEGIVGSTTGLLLGGGSRLIHKAILSPEGQPIGETQINVTDRESAQKFFNQNGVPNDVASAMATITDRFSSQLASEGLINKEDWYTNTVNEKNFSSVQSNGQATQQRAQSVFDSFDSDPGTAIKVFSKRLIESLPADKIQELKDSLKIKPNTPPAAADAKLDGAFVRYLWDGQTPSPELADPLETMKQVLRDVYKNVSATGSTRLTPESRVVLDSLLAPETEDISKARLRVKALSEVLDQNFPEDAKPSAVIPQDKLEELMKPIEVQTRRYEEVPNEELPKEIVETVIRPRTKDEIKTAVDELIKQYTPPSPPERPKPLVNIEGLDRTETETRTLYYTAVADLDRLRTGRLIPTEYSGVEKRSQPEGYIRDQLVSEDATSTKKRVDFWNRVSDKLDSPRSWFSLESPLRRWKWGQKTIDLLSDKDAMARQMIGRWEEDVKRSYTSLSWKDRKWLQEVDSNGFTNIRKLLDKSGTIDNNVMPPNRTLADFQSTAWNINQDFGRLAERNGILMRYPDGAHKPYQQPDIPRMLRFVTDDTREALRTQVGPLYQGILESAKKFNPELAGMSTKQIGNKLSEIFVDSETKKNSALETARVFRIMPDIVKVNGKDVSIFHTEPLTYLRRAVRVQADRIAIGKVFGQSSIDEVPNRKLRLVAKGLGVEPINTQDAIVNRIKTRLLGLDQDALQAKLERKAKKGQVPDAQGMIDNLQSLIGEKLPQAQNELAQPEPLFPDRDPLKVNQIISDATALAKKLGISLRPTRQEYLDSVSSVTATNMKADQVKALRKIAKQLEGVNTELPSHELLSEIKSRLNEDPQDLLDTLKKNLSLESDGVADNHFSDLIKASQGVPLYHIGKEGGIPKFASTILSVMNTSLRTLLHIPQTAILVPQFSGVWNYITAMDAALKNFKDVKSGLVTMGAVPEVINSWGFERGYMMSGLGKMIRQGFEKGSFLQTILDFNNVVAGEAARRWAQTLKDGKLNSSDISTLRSLKLKPEEIKAIQNGQMSDLSFSKIVQNSVALTQFNTQSTTWKGKIEVNPYTQMLFAYSGYAIATGRAMSSFARETLLPALDPRNIKKNPVATARALRDVLVIASSSIGAGLATQILRDIPHSSINRDQDKNVVEKGLGALTQVAFLGPASFIQEAYHFNDPQDLIVGLMPQVQAIGDLISFGVNEIGKAFGARPIHEKNARFGIGHNILELLKSETPAIKAIGRVFDDIVYPDQVAYREAKGVRSEFKRKLGETQPASKQDEPLDPFKEEVFNYVMRGDLPNAFKSAMDYRQHEIEEFAADPYAAMVKGKSLQKIDQELHDSLMGRAPLDMNPLARIEFLSGLPNDRARKYWETDLKYRAMVNTVAPDRSK